MLTLEDLREFTKKFNAVEKNVVREYVQHLFLSNLYISKEAHKLYFKGGTALKLIYQSPRFSEDLDFTGHLYRHNEIDELLLKTLVEVERIGLSISLKEAKTTSGGYLGIIHYQLYDFVGNMNIEISLRSPKRSKSEVVTIINDFTIPYSITQLSAKELVQEKIQATLRRGKPRDFYDIYFVLRSNLPIDKKNLELGRVLHKLESMKIDFRKELMVLLPRSHHMILKDFKSKLRNEIKRHGF